MINSRLGHCVKTASSLDGSRSGKHSSFPKAWLRDVKFIKNVNLAVSGRYLLMFRPSTNKWTDPEFSEDTGNAVGRTSVNQIPPTRIFSGTIAVTF